MIRVESNGNIISVSGTIGLSDYKRVLAALHSLTQLRGYQDVVIDLKQVAAAFAGPMLAIGAAVDRLRHEDRRFEFTFPEEDRLRRLFRNAGWLNLLDPNEEQPPSYVNTQHVPVVSFHTSEEQFVATNRLLDTVLASLPGLSRHDLGALEWAISEVTDNVLLHSQSPVGGLVQLSAYPDRRRVELAVADPGVGMPTTLRRAFPECWPDSRALERAVQEGVSGNKAIGRGNGLFGTVEIARVSNGYIHIHSGYGRLHYEADQLQLDDDNIPNNGSLVVANLDCSDPGALGRALRFEGRQHEPLDVVDTRYATEDLEAISFKVLRDSPSVGSREAGVAFRTKVENLLGMRPDARLVLDFTGVGVVSSSFADEVVGKLFQALGPLGFMSRVALAGMNSTVRGLLDRAILQRSQQEP